jgi:hypothetical protein
METSGHLILYQSEDGNTSLEVHLKDESVWLTQAQMADLFQCDRSVVTKHINNIFKEGELQQESNVQKMHIASSDKPVSFYNLDVIISVGYRVNTHRGIQFRIWATKTIREYIVKGFVIDDERLSGKRTNYFDELIERVRKIRTSEANFYEKVKEIFATSIDYQPSTETAKTFYATVQNKFHFAITGFTAAEIIVNRVNASKPRMGLIHTKGERATRKEAIVAKNYLEELELRRLELLVEQFLSFAELQSLEKRPMYMQDWKNKLDEFIRFNDKKVLTNAGTVSHSQMEQIVGEEYSLYTQKLLSDSDHTQT